MIFHSLVVKASQSAILPPWEEPAWMARLSVNWHRLTSRHPQREPSHRNRRAAPGQPFDLQAIHAGGEGRRVDGDQQGAEVVEREARGLEDRGAARVRERRAVGGVVGIARLYPEGNPARL